MVLVVFGPVPAGDEREALIAAIGELSMELGYVEGSELPRAESRLGGRPTGMGILSIDDERLVASLRSALAKVAVALGDEESEASTGSAVGAALDGAEAVIRGQLMGGNAAKLPGLMPDFVFLVVLPVVDLDRALMVSRRTRELVESLLE